MTKQPLHLFVPLIAAGWLAACATSGDSNSQSELDATLADPRTQEAVERVCFTRGIDSFRDNRDRTVVVRRGVKDDYLLVMRSCPQLDHAQGLAFTDRRTACLTRNDRVIVSESPFALRGPGQIGSPVCFVDAIYRWDESAASGNSEAAEPEG